MPDFRPEDRAKEITNRWLANESPDVRKLCAEEVAAALREAMEAGRRVAQSKPAAASLGRPAPDLREEGRA
jgi:hypothetical protein